MEKNVKLNENQTRACFEKGAKKNIKYRRA